MKLKQIVLSVFVLMLASGMATAQLFKDDPDLHDNVIWKGKNGKSIRAKFMYEDGTKIAVVDVTSDKYFTFDRSELSKETLEWFDRAFKRQEENTKKWKLRKENPNPKPEPVTPKAAPEGFEPIAGDKLKRADVPVLSQGDYGNKGSDCVPNSFAAFFLWWDQHSNLEIPRGRDFDDKAQWIHKEFSRRFATRNNSGTQYRKLKSGLQEYFERYYKGDVQFDYQETGDITPANLARLTEGSGATILTMSMYKGNRKDGGHAVALTEASEDGMITFVTWGKTFRGKLVSVEKLEGRTPFKDAPKEKYEIELPAGLNVIPDWMKQQKVKLYLDPMNWDCVLLLTPYLKSEAAKK